MGCKLNIDIWSDYYCSFQRKFLGVILISALLFSVSFIAADIFDLNKLGNTQLLLMMAYTTFIAVLSVLHFIYRVMHTQISIMLLISSFLIFSSAFIFVTHDELRAVWFFMGVGGSYILLGMCAGITFTVASLFFVVMSNSFLQIPYSHNAIVTITVSLSWCSIFFFTYTLHASGLYKRLQVANEHLHTLSMYDGLTNLPNRRLLIDRLQRAVADNRRNSKFGALLFLDIDRFKELNDTGGHAVGDMLLVEIGRRLASCVRETDTVARIGGDEFVVLLPALSEESDVALTEAEVIAAKIQEVLNEPYQLGTLSRICTSSIGLAIVGQSEDVEAILECADLAMYAAKKAGSNLETDGFRSNCPRCFGQKS